MSSDLGRPDFEPFIALAEKGARALRTDMLRSAHRKGFTELAPSHNAVFAVLPPEGSRAADMAVRAGITRQSMGEVIRDMIRVGLVETVPDPADGRAKIVKFTAYGKRVASGGYRHILELEERFSDEFGEEDWATTRRVLGRVREILNSDAVEPPTPAALLPEV